MVRDFLAEAPKELDVTVIHARWPEDKKLAAAMDAEYLIGAVAGPSPEMLKALPKLRFVQSWGAGVEWLPKDVLAALHIVVARNGGSNSKAVCETTITLMLALYRKLDTEWRIIEQGKWRDSLDLGSFHELSGKTVGLIGFGHIGKGMAQRLKGWAGRVLYTDVKEFPKELEQRYGVERVTFETLLRESDIVSPHVPLNPGTFHMMSDKQFAMMKPTAIFVNTSRGRVVDEPALIRALRDKRIVAAGLDVFEQEPVAPDNPLLEMDNAFLLPHRAGDSMDTCRRQARFGFQNVMRVVRGEPPMAQVWPIPPDAGPLVYSLNEPDVPA